MIKIPEPKKIVDLVKTYSFNGLWTSRAFIAVKKLHL